MRNTNVTNPATSLTALTHPPLHNIHVKDKTCLLKTAVAYVGAFGASQSHHKGMAVATVYVKTQSKEYIPISVFVVPTIAVPLKLSATSKVRTLPYLQGFI